MSVIREFTPGVLHSYTYRVQLQNILIDNENFVEHSHTKREGNSVLVLVSKPRIKD